MIDQILDWADAHEGRFRLWLGTSLALGVLVEWAFYLHHG